MAAAALLLLPFLASLQDVERSKSSIESLQKLIQALNDRELDRLSRQLQADRDIFPEVANLLVINYVLNKAQGADQETKGMQTILNRFAALKDPSEAEQKLAKAARARVDAAEKMSKEDAGRFVEAFQILIRIKSKAYAKRPKQLQVDLKKAVDLAEALGDPWLKGSFAQEVAAQCVHSGRVEESLKPFEKAIELAREMGDRPTEAACLTSLGTCYSKLDRFAEALKCHGDALQIMRETKNRLGEGVALDNMAVVWSKQKRTQQALELSLQALKIFREIGNQEEEAVNLGNIGEDYRELGRYKEALEYLEAGLKLSQKIGKPMTEGIILDNLAIAYRFLGRPEDSIRSHTESIKLLHDIGAKGEEAIAWTNLGGTQLKLARYAEAVAAYEKGIEVYREIGDPHGEAKLIEDIAEVLLEQGKTDDAIQRLEDASKLSSKEGSPVDQANLLNCLGYAKRKVGAFDQSIEHHRKAIELARLAKDPAAEAGGLSYMGDLYEELLRWTEALGAYEAALKIHEASGDKSSQAAALNRLGHVSRELCRYEASLKYFAQALALSKETGNRMEESITHTGLGITYSKMGRFDLAIASHEASLALARETGDRKGVGTILANIGLVHAKAGKYRRAFERLEEALKLDRETGNQRAEAGVLLNLGNTCLEVERVEAGLKYLQESLKIHRAIRDRVGEAVTLIGIGSVYSNRRQFEAALEAFIKALEILGGTGMKEHLASLLNDLGETYSRLDRFDEAKETFQKAIEISREIGDRDSEGTTRDNLGGLLLELGRFDEARDQAQAAVDIFRETGNRRREANALANLGFVYWILSDTPKMVATFEAAVKAAESVRASLGMLEGEKQAWMKKSRTTFEFAALSLQLAGRLEESFGYLEGLRSRNLLDAMSHAASVPAELSEKKAGLLMRYNQARGALQSLSRELESNKDERDRKFLRSEIEKSRAELARAEQELVQASREIELKDTLEEVTPLKLGDVQKRLREGEALLFYHAVELPGFVTGRKKEKHGDLVLVGVVTRDTFELKSIETREGFRDEVRWFRESAIVSARGLSAEGYKARARGLYKVLIEPVAKELEGARRLIVAPDELLYSIPFEALPASDAGKDYSELDALGAHYEVEYTSSATLFAKRREGKSKTGQKFVGFGDPDYSSVKAIEEREIDESHAADAPEDLKKFMARPAGAVRGGWARLPHSGEEAAAIAKIFGAEPILGAEASEKNARSMQDVRIAHFACHGYVNRVEPMKSALVLTSDKDHDGYLEAREIADLKLPCELVVLSACDSASGEMLRGEGLIGLTRAFMIAGAQSVIASLWTVSDEGGKEFMVSFYTKLAAGKDKVAALAETKREFMRSEKYSAPYYWAGFVLHGE